MNNVFNIISKDRRIVYLIGIITSIVLIFVLPFKSSTITLLSTVIIYSIAAIGFNLLLGYSGQISLGHAAFIGLGAYTSAFITSNLEMPFIIGLIMAGIVPMLAGIVLGMVALRLEGHYLAIATLGFGIALQQVFKVLTYFTDGFAGKTAPSAKILGLTIKTGKPYLVFIAVILLFMMIAAHNLVNSKTGRALIAMRDSEHVAKAMGIDVISHKLKIFALSAFYAGIAGSLYMHLVKYTQPDVWGMGLSLNLLAMVVIGGLCSMEGSILGSAFIVLMPHIVHEIPIINKLTNSSIILTGITIILVIRFFPGGLVSIYKKFKTKIKKREVSANVTS